MLILKTKKENVIEALREYSSGLNKGKVKKTVWDNISSVYFTIRDHTMDSAWYIELDAAEIAELPREFLCPVLMKDNLAVTVFLGRNTSVYTKGKLEEGFCNAARLFFLPTDQPTDKAKIYFSCLDATVAALYDVDYAIRLLDYD